MIRQTRIDIVQLVINIFFCMVHLYEVMRTKYWKLSPNLDSLDVEGLELAALSPDTGNEYAVAMSLSGVF